MKSSAEKGGALLHSHGLISTDSAGNLHCRGAFSYRRPDAITCALKAAAGETLGSAHASMATVITSSCPPNANLKLR